MEEEGDWRDYWEGRNIGGKRRRGRGGLGFRVGV
jgi:hypothetical protein